MRDLPIAYGHSSHAKKWSNKTTTFDDLCERLKTTIRTPESVEEYAKMKSKEREALVGSKRKTSARFYKNTLSNRKNHCR